MRYIVQWSDPNTPLAVPSIAMGVQVNTSTSQHPEVAIGHFSGWSFGKGETVRNYYGKLAYTDLAHEWQAKKTYGEDIIGLTVAQIEKWDFQMDKRAVHGTTGILCVYIIQAKI